jgi:DNA-binding MarR family transcriptional regulator
MNLLHNSGSSSEAQRATLLERLFELAALLMGAMRNGLVERGLTPPRAEVIWLLHQRPAMTQRVLSQALRCTPRNVTDLVDALEHKGLVARVQHPTDRRSTLVSLTSQGEAEATRMQAGHHEVASALFADLPPAELGVFASVLDQTMERLRQLALMPQRADECDLLVPGSPLRRNTSTRPNAGRAQNDAAP